MESWKDISEIFFDSSSASETEVKNSDYVRMRQTLSMTILMNEQIWLLH